MTTPIPTELEKQAARERARDACERGHQWPTDVVNLLSRTLGEAMVRRAHADNEAA